MLKKLKKSLLVAFSLLFVFITLVNAEVPSRVNWRSSSALNSKAVAEASAKTAITASDHFVIQFENIPSEEQKQALIDQGIELLTYVGDEAYFAKFISKGDLSYTVNTPIHEDNYSIYAINTANKLHPRIIDQDFPGYALFNPNAANGTKSTMDSDDADVVCAVYVIFHSDYDTQSEECLDLISCYGGEVRSYMLSINAMVVWLPKNSITDFAAEDAVQWIEPPLPPLGEANDSNRVVTQADTVQSAPYSLDGTGVTVLVYDGGYADSGHTDFGGRLTVRDSAGLSDHATHVSGTIGGDGSLSGGQYRGMAPSVTIQSYGFEYDGSGQFLYTNPGDLEADYLDAISNYGAMISNNSIGTNVAPNGFDCAWEGDYGATAMLIDAVVGGSLGEPMRIIWANGNERGSGRCGSTYLTTAPPACAKNHITVGALNSNDDSMTYFSSWGPTDDGRMKPDISAPGCQSNSDGGVTSTIPGNSYDSYCGTSMAAPTVTGLSALLLQEWQAMYPGQPLPRNSLLKTMLAHNAVDLGNTGPDYQFGYGSVRIKDTVDFLMNESFLNDSVVQGDQKIFYVMALPGDAELKATIAWDDVPGAANTIPELVNDLDLVAISPSGITYYPWLLDPSNPSLAATTGVDHRNNIEQVVVNSPESGIWQIVVSGYSIPGAAQVFSLTCTPDLQACSSDGTLFFDKSSYSDSSTASVVLNDCDLNLDDTVVETVVLTVTSTSETQGEDIVLTETDALSGEFLGSIDLSPVDFPGVLYVVSGDDIEVSYIDSSDGQGGTNVLKTDIASIDGEAPVFNGLQTAQALYGHIELTWMAAVDPSVPLTYNVFRSTVQGGQDFNTPIASTSDLSFIDTTATNATLYWYVVRAADSIGNEEKNTIEKSAILKNAEIPFLENFENSTILGNYWKISGTGTYRTQVTSANSPYEGNYHITMDSTSDSSVARNELTLSIALEGYEGVVLSFWMNGFLDEFTTPGSNPFQDGADFDGIAISEDGVTWYYLDDVVTFIPDVYTQYVVDLDAAIAEYGLSYNDNFKIRFNQYDNYPIATDGLAFDKIEINGAMVDDLYVSPADGFSFSGTKGEQFDLAEKEYRLVNIGDQEQYWTVTGNQSWYEVVPSSGALPANDNTSVFVKLTDEVYNLGVGIHSDVIQINNITSGNTFSRDIQVVINLPGPIMRVDVPISIELAIEEDKTFTYSPGLTIFNEGPPLSMLNYDIYSQYALYNDLDVDGQIGITARTEEQKNLIFDSMVNSEGNNNIGEPSVGKYSLETFEGNSSVQVEILAFTKYTDKRAGGEYENTLNAIYNYYTSINVAQTIAETAADLSSDLVGKNILLIPEQELWDGESFSNWAGDVSSAVNDFCSNGGIVIVTDHVLGDEFINGTGLMHVGENSESGSSSELCTVLQPNNPVMSGVQTNFSIMSGNSSYTGDTDGIALASVDKDGNAAVLEWRIGQGSVFLFACDFFSYNDDMSRMISNIVLSFAGSSSWVSVESPTYGSIASGDYVDKDITINTNGLLPGTYYSSVVVDPGQTGLSKFNIPCSLVVLPEPLEVTPLSDMSFEGVSSGHITPVSYTYTVSNLSSNPMTWEFSAANSIVEASPNQGVLGANDSIAVTITLVDAVKDYAAGSYHDTVTFNNLDNGTTFSRSVSVLLHEPLEVTPLSDMSFEGSTGGPFTPVSYAYTVTNGSFKALNWEFTSVNSLVNATPNSGVLDPNEIITVTVTLDDAVRNYGPGSYQDTVTFTNLDNGTVLSREVMLEIYTPSIFHEDFEDGTTLDPCWTVSGTNTYRTQVTSSYSPHGGSYHITMDSSSDSSYARNELTLTIDLENYENVVLSFWMNGFLDEFTTPTSNPFQIGADFDGIAISEDGATWYYLDNVITSIPSVYTEYVVDLDAAITQYGLSYNSNFKIRFNQYDNYEIDTDGLAFDDILMTGNKNSYVDAPQLAEEDVYTVGFCNEVNWTSVPEVEMYTVQCASDSNFTTLQEEVQTTGTGYMFCEMVPGQRYWYRVMASIITESSWLQTTQSDFYNDAFYGTNAVENPGSVVLNRVGGASYFKDGFEDGDYSDWTTGSGGYTVEVSSEAAVGAYSISLTGGNSGHYNGLMHSLNSVAPEEVSFYVRSSSNTLTEGYFVIGTGASGDSSAVFFYMKYDGTMGIYNNAWHSVPYEGNRWYNIKFVFDWTAKTVDYYVDNTLAIGGLDFRNTALTNLTNVYLYNYDSGQAWWDDITFGGPGDEYELSGNIVSEPVSILDNNSWSTVNFNVTNPVDTDVTVDILDASDSSVIETDVASGQDISGITAKSIKLRANLETVDSTVSPSLNEWSIDYLQALSSNWSNVESSTQILPQIGLPDFNGDNNVDILDLNHYVLHWLRQDCLDSNYWCVGTDLNSDGSVDLFDLNIISMQWLDQITPPVDPNTGHWKLDEISGSTAFDSSIYQYDGTVYGDPNKVSGVDGGAYEFDGIEDYIEMVGYKGIGGIESRTVAVWIKADEDLGNNDILMHTILSWGYTDIAERWQVLIDEETGQLALAAFDGRLKGGDDLEDGQWHHVAAVFPEGANNLNQVKLYVDGSEVLTNSAELDSVLYTVLNNNVLIGAVDTNTSTDAIKHYFNGSIDEVQIFSRELSDTEIADLASN